jgi:hypothetical protein
MPIKFTITSKTATKAEGTLTWTEKSLTANAVSGPFGNGFIESGLYHAKRNVLLDKPGEPPYCDSSSPSTCWFQLISPQFSTTRTEIGIHPDGNTPGTAGCIGITISNTKPWYDALKSVAEGQYTVVEVIDRTVSV